MFSFSSFPLVFKKDVDIGRCLVQDLIVAPEHQRYIADSGMRARGVE